MQTPNLDPQQLAGMIDHSFLKPFGPPESIEKLCAEALEYGFAMVAINPAEVERCVKLLAGSSVRVGAAIGFPLGQSTVAVKEYETKDSVDRGAGEIDMVINIRALQAGDVDLVRREIELMVELCRSNQVISKVILETCYLSEAEKRQVCQLSLAAGADFVKTSTGFGPAGATVADIQLIRETVGPKMGVKASGGVKNFEMVLALIAAGATRIGTSSGVAIIEELKTRK
jgi:deoxyribose-phosphate aldolase